MQYKGKVKERTPERKIGLVIMGAIVLYLSIEQQNLLYIIIATLLLFAVFFNKEHILDEKGSHIIYYMFGLKITDYFWPWDEISAVAPNYEKVKDSSEVLLEINREISIRPFIFKRSQIDEILEFCKEMNPDMYVDDRTEQQRREDKLYHEAKMEYAKERAKEARKAKRKKK